ncbi:hypothetical protein [Alteromonas sp. S167]|uniref:hypothetical protein n=1 Tax=Alteromonas sp. S167 TaxID=3117402 RepID=UPI002FE14C6A
MSTSEHLRLTKALKKDQVYNWFDKYETKPSSGNYVMNQNIAKQTRNAVKQTKNAGSPASAKLNRMKRKLKVAVRAKVRLA